jgi:hypothetical protein
VVAVPEGPWGVRLDFGTTRLPAVVARHVFYDRSVYDGGDRGEPAADDFAIAPDKRPLLPGGAASFANVTSYARGINGIMVDVQGLPTTALAGIAAAARFRAGAGGDPAGWAEAPGPTLIGIRPGAGIDGSDRITVTWPDGAIRNRWLQVTIPSVGNPRLPADDVFYFGNLVGEGGDVGAGFLRVNALDLAAVKRAANTDSPITGRYDFNRDGRVNALDLSAARASLNGTLRAPASASASAAAPAGAPPSGTGESLRAQVERVWDEAHPEVLA